MTVSLKDRSIQKSYFELGQKEAEGLIPRREAGAKAALSLVSHGW
jgi:hypothetical protein